MLPRKRGYIDALKSLHKREMDIDVRNAINMTPLYRAAAEGNVDVVRLLIRAGRGGGGST